MKKLLIGVPCASTVKTKFMLYLIDALKTGYGIPIQLEVRIGSIIHDARNRIMYTAYSSGADYALWIDSDMTFLPSDVLQLIRDAKTTDADLITGCYFKRAIPTSPVFHKDLYWKSAADHYVTDFEEYPKDSLFEIGACGFGFCITKVSTAMEMVDTFKEAPFQPLPGLGEDYSYCERLARLGGRMLCDSRIQVGHMGDIIYNEQTWLLQKDAAP